MNKLKSHVLDIDCTSVLDATGIAGASGSAMGMGEGAVDGGPSVHSQTMVLHHNDTGDVVSNWAKRYLTNYQ
jgi:hypothetical protein